MCAVAYATVGAVSRLADDFAGHKGKIEAFCSKDSGITSAQAVELLINSGVDVYLLGSNVQKYHPKFWFGWSTAHPRFEVIIGSGNLTVGGLWINVEASSRLSGNQEDAEDRKIFETAFRYAEELRKYVGTRVVAPDIARLVLEGDLRDESARRTTEGRPPSSGEGQQVPVRKKGPPPFGQIKVPPPSKYALNLATARPTRPGQKRPVAKLTLAPDGFIMMLNKIKGPRIPGEIRIPIAAVRAAEDFWDWPDLYIKDASKTGTFYNRTPTAVWNVRGGRGKAQLQPARLYLYKQSMDFRLYSTAIRDRIDEGEGDIIAIWRSEAPGVDYDVQIILRTDQTYTEALALCTERVPNSRRRWGFLPKPS